MRTHLEVRVSRTHYKRKHIQNLIYLNLFMKIILPQIEMIFPVYSPIRKPINLRNLRMWRELTNTLTILRNQGEISKAQVKMYNA